MPAPLINHRASTPDAGPADAGSLRGFALAAVATALLAGALPAGVCGLEWAAVPLLAQLAPAAPVDTEPIDGVWLPSERTKIRGIEKARQGIAAGNFTETLRFLDEVLGEPEDSWIKTQQANAVGLKHSVRRMLRDLPAEGREAYESTYGPAAERLLTSFLASGDAAALQQAVERYFYTPAGLEAAMLLGQQEADGGNFHSAALLYQQLLDYSPARRRFDPELSAQAAAAWMARGQAGKAEEILANARARGDDVVTVGGRSVRFASEGSAQLIDRLSAAQGAQQTVLTRRWLTHRGNAARNAHSRGGLPHMRIRWDQQLLEFGKLERVFDDFAAELLRSGAAAPVAGAPLAAGNYVIVRTPHSLLAVDFTTGKRVWETPRQRDPLLEDLVRQRAIVSDEDADPGPARAFARRMWEDYLYGVVSSDGERVFVVRDLPMSPVRENDVFAAQMMRGRGVTFRGQTNRLCAYELSGRGEMSWEINGNKAGELRGAFFLGAPLALGGTLYGLAEIRGSAVELFALEARTGQVLWRQPLAHLERGVADDSQRRMQAAIPSFDEGVLVCPTGAGVVIAVDLAQRSLSWSYRYATQDRPQFRNRVRIGNRGSSTKRWSDVAAVIHNGRLLLTPPESPDMHCVDLHSGELLWKRTRGKSHYLAGVDDDCILLTGPRRVTALALSDGQPLWDKPLLLPDGVAPSGSGFFADGKYYLPLSSSEVAAIDLAAGRIVARTQRRDNYPLGNLICYQGAILSHNGRYLECFDQVDPLRTRAQQELAAHPDSVGALRTLGEIAFHAARYSDAIELLQRAYQGDPTDIQTREVLAECLIAALDDDFVAYRGNLDLLRQLDDGAMQRKETLLRIEAEGYADAGEPLAAAEACLAMYELTSDPATILQIKGSREVAVGRWVQAQLRAIVASCNAEQRAAIEQQVDALNPLSKGGGGEAQLAQFLGFFAALPGVERARGQYARLLEGADRPLAAQQIWLALAGSDDVAIRAAAVARISQGLHAAGLHRGALHYDRLLAGPLADEPGLDGKLAGEWIAARSDQAPGDADWPVGKVDVLPPRAMNQSTTQRNAHSPMLEIRLERTDPVLGFGNVMYSTRQRRVVIRDSYGQEFFSTALDQDQFGRTRNQGAGNLHGVSHGNVLVVSFGRRLLAFNTLASTGQLDPEIMWRADLTNNFDHLGSSARESGSAARPGSFRPERLTWEGAWMGVIGPVTESSCIYQSQRRLVCVDPLTGAELWRRTDVPHGCDLFGDSLVTIAIARGQRQGAAYSTIDGRLLGQVEAPPWKERLATLGQRIIRWQRESAGPRGWQFRLSSYEPQSGATLWDFKFDHGARVDVAQGRYVAVVEPSGRAVIVDAAEGQVLVDQQLRSTPGLSAIHLAVGADHFTLVTDRPQPAGSNRRVDPINRPDYDVVDGQAAVFDRATGRLLWGSTAEVSQQALMLSQPVDLPVLVFAATLHRHNSDGARPVTSLLVLDKKSGRTLYRSDSLPVTGGGHCLVRVQDLEERTIGVEMASRQIRLQFTDQPRPPAPPALAEVEAAGRNRTDGLGGILKRGILDKLRGIE